MKERPELFHVDERERNGSHWKRGVLVGNNNVIANRPVLEEVSLSCCRRIEIGEKERYEPLLANRLSKLAKKGEDGGGWICCATDRGDSESVATTLATTRRGVEDHSAATRGRLGGNFKELLARNLKFGRATIGTPGAG